jgi:predicted transcriptional regulator
MKVFAVCRDGYVEQDDLRCKNSTANQTRKKINRPYIVVLQIRQKIILSVATIVHPLQQLDDSNPN